MTNPAQARLELLQRQYRDLETSERACQDELKRLDEQLIALDGEIRQAEREARFAAGLVWSKEQS